MKRKVFLAIQILVSLVLLAWLFQHQNFRVRMGQILAEAHPGWLLLGFLIAGIGSFLGIFRWGIFVQMLGLQINNREIVRMGLVALFFNNFLIGTVGGDAVKVIWLASRGKSKSLALMSVAMDRMSGIMALVFCSFLFMIPRLDWLRQSEAVAALTRVIFVFLFVITGLFFLSLIGAYKKPARWLPERFPGRTKMIEMETAYGSFLPHWRSALVAGGISVFMFVTYYLTFYCAARAFDVKIPILDFVALMPTVDIISALPLSVGGFGVREHLFTVLLGDLCSVPSAQAVLISLGGAFLTMAWGLAGLIALPSYRLAQRDLSKVAS